jgi:hypothetical protein
MDTLLATAIKLKVEYRDFVHAVSHSSKDDNKSGTFFISSHKEFQVHRLL